MNIETQYFFLACVVSCAMQLIMCISFTTASLLSFSVEHILLKHIISFLAGFLTLTLLGVLTIPTLCSFILIIVPALLGCYGVALHAHNSIAFRIIYEIQIQKSPTFNTRELLTGNSCQELNVRRRLNQLIEQKYVVMRMDIVYPTEKGLRFARKVKFLRKIFGSLKAYS